MLGAIIGDIVGSIYEWDNHRSTSFPFYGEGCFFTDDSVMTVAVADWLMHGGYLAETLQRYGRVYPGRGYGGRFGAWLESTDPKPYNSWGNGSAMRVSAAGWARDTMEETRALACETAVVTHNHPEGIKGAESVAAAIFLARNGAGKEEIRDYVESEFGYDLRRTCDEIRPVYEFNESCQGTVPEAIIAFLESTDFENAIRLAISLGGDSDTLACITGAIAEAAYGIPGPIARGGMSRLDPALRITTQEFQIRYVHRAS